MKFDVRVTYESADGFMSFEASPDIGTTLNDVKARYPGIEWLRGIERVKVFMPDDLMVLMVLTVNAHLDAQAHGVYQELSDRRAEQRKLERLRTLKGSGVFELARHDLAEREADAVRPPRSKIRPDVLLLNNRVLHVVWWLKHVADVKVTPQHAAAAAIALGIERECDERDEKPNRLERWRDRLRKGTRRRKAIGPAK